MSTAFYEYVRGRTDAVPDGYCEKGMRVYRYLVRLGVTQMIHACYPGLRKELGDQAWHLLMDDFVRQSAWSSHFYGDLDDEFRHYLSRQIHPDVATKQS